MRENSLYDRKSLRAIHGPKADFKEIAKDCVGFANAQGGVIDLGIEDDADIPDAAQRIPEDLPTKLINKITGLTVRARSLKFRGRRGRSLGADFVTCCKEHTGVCD